MEKKSSRKDVPYEQHVQQLLDWSQFWAERSCSEKIRYYKGSTIKKSMLKN